MWILVTYDVNTETAAGRKRLRQVAQVCKNYGQRVQRSVFECSVNEMQYERMKQRLLRRINEKEDSLRLYRMTEPRDKHVEEFGCWQVIDFDEPLIM